MTEITNIQLVKKLGFWIPWTLWMIVSGLIWIKTGTVAFSSVIFMILPIIYTTLRNKEIWR